jgi:hypothetical protein
MGLWQRLTVRRLSSLRGDRSRLETDLRMYYASTLEQGWDPEAEDRVHARISRVIAAQRLESRASGSTFRLKRLAGPHVAAIVCAGAAVFAFGGMIDVGRGGSQAQIQPTSSPLRGQPARSTSNAKLSLISIQPPASVAMAV